MELPMLWLTNGVEMLLRNISMIIFVCLVLALTLKNSYGETRIEWIIIQAANQEGINANLLISLCKVESNLNPYATGDKTARYKAHGLCQIQTRTAKDRGFKGHVKELYSPFKSALYAARQLSYCFNQVGYWVKALDCYNKGLRWVRRNPDKAGKSRYVKRIYKRMHNG